MQAETPYKHLFLHKRLLTAPSYPDMNLYNLSYAKPKNVKTGSFKSVFPLHSFFCITSTVVALLLLQTDIHSLPALPPYPYSLHCEGYLCDISVKH